MKITIKREQSQTSFGLPNVSSLRKAKNTKLYRLFSLAIIAGLLSTGFSACKSKNAKKEEPGVAREVIKKEVGEYIYPLPSVFEVTNTLNEIEASYIIGLSNDPGKVESYFSEKEKALNLGVYAADLAYATTYNQKPEIQSYFKAIELLIRELDLTGAFSENPADQIESNLENKDKLVEIVTNMFSNAYSYLNKQGKAELSYLVLAGTAIEGLYLTTHVSENAYQNPRIVEAILFQKEPFIKLQQMMGPHKDSALLKDQYANISRINAIFAMEEGNTSLRQNQMIKLTEALKEIRGSIVK